MDKSRPKTIADWFVDAINLPCAVDVYIVIP